MTKQLPLTDEVIAHFKAKFGEEVEPRDFYIIRVRALDTCPIHQNTIYNGAVNSRSTLAEMCEKINFTDENIGIHIMHNAQDLNVGRVFYASTADENGVGVLYADLAILVSDETKFLIDRIEHNVLDEVSVSFKSKHAKCSECDFDYMSDEATFENWFEETCPNGHKIGVDGCHLECDGLDYFTEISIVNRGAAHNPKIINQNRNGVQFDKGVSIRTLAASGETPEFLVATFNSKMEIKMEENKEPEVLSADEKVANLEAQLAEAKKQLDLGEQVNSLKAQLSEKEKSVADKDSEIASLNEKIEEVNAKLAEANEKGEKMMSFLKEQVKKVAVAAGKKDVEVPEDLEGISAMLSENQQLLASLIPAGGVSQQVKASANDELEAARLKSFQVRN